MIIWDIRCDALDCHGLATPAYYRLNPAGDHVKYEIVGGRLASVVIVAGRMLGPDHGLHSC